MGMRGSVRAPQPAPEYAVSGNLGKMLRQSGEQAAAVGRTDRRLDVILRMRHQAEHIAPLVQDARDRVGGAVDIPARIESAVGGGIAERDPAIALQPRDGV